MFFLPEQFLKRMQERLGDSYPAFLASYDRPPYRGLRVNTLKLSTDEFAGIAPPSFRLGDKISDFGFYTEGERLGADPYHFAGLYYLQEPSAMTVGELTADCKKGRVLDLCAAPGGKTTLVAAQMAGEGILIANEIDRTRAKILSENVERTGIKNCAVVSAFPDALTSRFREYFDLILVDAPCSGEGMFKKEENAVPEWSVENVRMCAARQKKILSAAAKMLCGGGRIVYSTCTFSEEEDEWQIEEFLRENPGFVLKEQRKLYPHAFRGEGHYAAVLEKSSTSCSPICHGGGGINGIRPFPIHRNAAAERGWKEFCADFFGETLDGDVHTLADGRMYLVPCGMPDLAGEYLLRLGVQLGEWDGKRFKPAHALVMAYGSKAKRQIILDRVQAKAYLRGETLAFEGENGWAAVMVDGFPLGLGKIVSGAVKNHYPKPLRLRTND